MMDALEENKYGKKSKKNEKSDKELNEEFFDLMERIKNRNPLNKYL